MSEAKYSNIIITDISLESHLWAENDPSIRYVGLPYGMSIREKTTKVIDLLHEEAASSSTTVKRTPTTKKKILVAIFDDAFDGVEIRYTVKKYVKDINDANKSLGDVHEVVFSNANLQLDSCQCFDLYKYVISVNEENGMVTCNPNKAMQNKKRITKTSFLKNKLDGSKKVLSDLGKHKLRRFYLKFFKHSFSLRSDGPSISSSINANKLLATRTTENMVITDVILKQEVLQKNNPQDVQYVFLEPHISIENMKDQVIEIMNMSELPLKLIVAIFDGAAANQVGNNILEKCVLDIDDATHQMKRHEVVYSAANFIPLYEHKWEQLFAFNNFLRVVNLRNNHSDCRPFKFFLNIKNKANKGMYKYQIDGKYWQEYTNNTGLGETLSLKGMDTLNKFYQRFFEFDNFDPCKEDVDHTTHFLEKSYITPLYKTDGYKTKYKWPEGTIFPLFKDYRCQLEDSSHLQDAPHSASGFSHHFVPMQAQTDFPCGNFNNYQPNDFRQPNDFTPLVENPRMLDQRNALGAFNQGQNNESLSLQFHDAGKGFVPINQTINDWAGIVTTDEHELKILHLQQKNDKIKQEIMLQELAINERKQKLLLAEKAIDLNKHRFNKIKDLDDEEERLLDEVLEDVDCDIRMLEHREEVNLTNFDQQCSDFISEIKSQQNHQKDNYDQSGMTNFDKQCNEWNQQIQRKETRFDSLDDSAVQRHDALNRDQGILTELQTAEENTKAKLVNVAASGYNQQEFAETQHSKPRHHKWSGQREDRVRDYRSRSNDRGEREKLRYREGSRGDRYIENTERSRGSRLGRDRLGGEGEHSRWDIDRPGSYEDRRYKSRGYGERRERSRGYEEGRERFRGFEEKGVRSRGYEEGRERSRGYEAGRERSRGYEEGRERSRGYEEGRERSRGYEERRDRSRERENVRVRARGQRDERELPRSIREERHRSRSGEEGRYRSSEYLERLRNKYGDVREGKDEIDRIARDEFGDYISSSVPSKSRGEESRPRDNERGREYERRGSYSHHNRERSSNLVENNPSFDSRFDDNSTWNRSRLNQQGHDTYRSRSRERSPDLRRSSSSNTEEKQRAFQNQWSADTGPKPRLDSVHDVAVAQPSNPKLPKVQLPQPVRPFRTRHIFNPKKAGSTKSNYNEEEETEIPGLDLPTSQPQSPPRPPDNATTSKLEAIGPSKPLQGRVLYPGDISSNLSENRNQSFGASSGPSTISNPPTAQFGRPLSEVPTTSWNQSAGPSSSWNQSAGVLGSWNQSAGPPGSWNQSAGPPGSWNQSAGPSRSWNQSTDTPGSWNQSAGPPGSLNQAAGASGSFNTGQWNQPGMSAVPDQNKIIELQNYIKRQESSKQLNNYRINI